MHRRSFLTGVAALAAPSYSSAQQRASVPRVGVMLVQPVEHPFVRAFRKGLRDLGYIEGENIHVEYRSVNGDISRLPSVAAEFARIGVDVIVAGGGSVGPRAAGRVTQSIPIVFPVAADPVRLGFVKSLARPGGNLTGLALLEAEINAKRLQLAKELLPKIERIAVIADRSMAAYADGVAASKDAARALGLRIQVLSPGSPHEVEAAFKSAKDAGAQAVV